MKVFGHQTTSDILILRNMPHLTGKGGGGWPFEYQRIINIRFSLHIFFLKIIHNNVMIWTQLFVPKSKNPIVMNCEVSSSGQDSFFDDDTE